MNKSYTACSVIHVKIYEASSTEAANMMINQGFIMCGLDQDILSLDNEDGLLIHVGSMISLSGQIQGSVSTNCIQS